MKDWPDRFARDMACARAEWERLLLQALTGQVWTRLDDTQVRIDLEGGTLTLRWAEGPPRRMALLRLPTLQLLLHFDGVPPAARRSFMKHLDLYTHRGGG